MLGSKEDIEIDEAITYSLATDSFSKPLKLTNKSSHIYVFKIKTNQRSVISMQVTHDFIKPESTKTIVIKLAEKPSDTTPLRLELNYVIPTEEEIRTNDSKMNSYGRDAVFRRVITIHRDDSAKPAPSLSSSFHNTSREEVVQPNQSSIINISAISQPEEKREEKREERKEEIREQVKREEVKREEVKREVRVDPPVAASTPIKYPDLSYIRQVESEQISVVTGKSTELDVTELVAEVPISSEEAIKAYNSPIDIEQVKNQKPSIAIPEEKAENFIPAVSSPRKSQSPEKRLQSPDEMTLRELNEKLEKEQGTITRLKNQQISNVRSDCVYPIPIIYLLVLAGFLGGALLNWIVI